MSWPRIPLLAHVPGPLLVLLLVAGCSPLRVSYDYDPAVDFRALHTWRWYPQPQTRPAINSVQRDPLLELRVQRAIERTLKARGYALSEQDDASFYVAAYVRMDRYADVQLYPYSYYDAFGPGWYGAWPGYGYAYGSGWGYRYAGYPRTSIYYYEEGTLIVDVIDAGTRRLIWRSIGRHAVDPDDSPAGKDKSIDAAVRKMLSHFPPKR